MPRKEKKTMIYKPLTEKNLKIFLQHIFYIKNEKEKENSTNYKKYKPKE